jgi:hypothetical protein
LRDIDGEVVTDDGLRGGGDGDDEESETGRRWKLAEDMVRYKRERKGKGGFSDFIYISLQNWKGHFIRQVRGQSVTMKPLRRRPHPKHRLSAAVSSSSPAVDGPIT